MDLSGLPEVLRLGKRYFFRDARRIISTQGPFIGSNDSISRCSGRRWTFRQKRDDYLTFNYATLLRYRANIHRRRCTNGLFIALKRPFPAASSWYLGIAPPCTFRNAHSCSKRGTHLSLIPPPPSLPPSLTRECPRHGTRARRSVN